jgi:hypothetical protein
VVNCNHQRLTDQISAPHRGRSVRSKRFVSPSVTHPEPELKVRQKNDYKQPSLHTYIPTIIVFHCAVPVSDRSQDLHRFTVDALRSLVFIVYDGVKNIFFRIPPPRCKFPSAGEQLTQMRAFLTHTLASSLGGVAVCRAQAGLQAASS